MVVGARGSHRVAVPATQFVHLADPIGGDGFPPLAAMIIGDDPPEYLRVGVAVDPTLDVASGAVARSLSSAMVVQRPGLLLIDLAGPNDGRPGASEVARGVMGLRDAAVLDERAHLALVGPGSDARTAIAGLGKLLERPPSDVQTVVVALPVGDFVAACRHLDAACLVAAADRQPWLPLPGIAYVALVPRHSLPMSDPGEIWLPADGYGRKRVWEQVDRDALWAEGASPSAGPRVPSVHF